MAIITKWVACNADHLEKLLRINKHRIRWWRNSSNAKLLRNCYYKQIKRPAQNIFSSSSSSAWLQVELIVVGWWWSDRNSKDKLRTELKVVTNLQSTGFMANEEILGLIAACCSFWTGYLQEHWLVHPLPKINSTTECGSLLLVLFPWWTIIFNLRDIIFEKCMQNNCWPSLSSIFSTHSFTHHRSTSIAADVGNYCGYYLQTNIFAQVNWFTVFA